MACLILSLKIRKRYYETCFCCRVVEAQWGHLSKETWLIISKGRIRIQVGLSTKFMPFPSTLQKHPEGKGQVRGWLLSVQRGSAEETEPLPTGPFGLCIVVPHMARLPQCSGHMLIRNLGSP